ncbi:hypothetical protein J6590_000301 [Homalodisca vitripennis]|nr:hypothetical protein J6590_000301 [Homalodisca vitripennis]
MKKTEEQLSRVRTAIFIVLGSDFYSKGEISTSSKKRRFLLDGFPLSDLFFRVHCQQLSTASHSPPSQVSADSGAAVNHM